MDQPRTVPYSKYAIQEKRDFGDIPHWIDGFPVQHGYVVVLDGCNPMPGAIWFQTVRDAKLACDILDRTGETLEFWAEWKRIQETATAIARGYTTAQQLSITDWEVVPECSNMLDDNGDYSETVPVRFFLSVKLSDGRSAKIPIGSHNAERIAQAEYVGGIIAPIVNRHFGTWISSEDW